MAANLDSPGFDLAKTAETYSASVPGLIYSGFHVVFKIQREIRLRFSGR
ncbi:MAG: hypothetical protein HY746_04745 [Elusimicrobia bacterium]|nr:hypothetical protein [Elusimicrobiota bacterium]